MVDPESPNNDKSDPTEIEPLIGDPLLHKKKARFWQTFFANLRAAGLLAILQDLSAITKEIAESILIPGFSSATFGAVTVGILASVLKIFIVAGAFAAGLGELVNFVFIAKNKNLEKLMRTLVLLVGGFLVGAAIIGSIVIGEAFALGTVGSLALTAPILFLAATFVFVLWQSADLVRNYINYKAMPSDSLEHEIYAKRIRANVITLGICISSIVVMLFAMVFTTAAAAIILTVSSGLVLIASGFIAHQIYEHYENSDKLQVLRELHAKYETDDPAKAQYYQQKIDECVQQRWGNRLNILAAISVMVVSILFAIGTFGIGVAVIGAVGVVALTWNHLVPRIKKYFEPKLDENQQLINKLKYESSPAQNLTINKQADNSNTQPNNSANTPNNELNSGSYRHRVYIHLKRQSDGRSAKEFLITQITSHLSALERKATKTQDGLTFKATRDQHKYDSLTRLQALLNSNDNIENYNDQITKIMQEHGAIEQSFWKDDVTFGKTKQLFDAARLYFNWQQDHPKVAAISSANIPEK